MSEVAVSGGELADASIVILIKPAAHVPGLSVAVAIDVHLVRTGVVGGDGPPIGVEAWVVLPFEVAAVDLDAVLVRSRVARVEGLDDRTGIVVDLLGLSVDSPLSDSVLLEARQARVVAWAKQGERFQRESAVEEERSSELEMHNWQIAKQVGGG